MCKRLEVQQHQLHFVRYSDRIVINHQLAADLDRALALFGPGPNQHCVHLIGLDWDAALYSACPLYVRFNSQCHISFHHIS